MNTIEQIKNATVDQLVEFGRDLRNRADAAEREFLTFLVLFEENARWQDETGDATFANLLKRTSWRSRPTTVATPEGLGGCGLAGSWGAVVAIPSAEAAEGLKGCDGLAGSGTPSSGRHFPG